MKKPLLALLKKKGEVSLTEAMAYIAGHFGISPKVQKWFQSCGKEPLLQNRLRWARWELNRDGKIKTTKRGYFKLV